MFSLTGAATGGEKLKLDPAVCELIDVLEDNVLTLSLSLTSKALIGPCEHLKLKPSMTLTTVPHCCSSANQRNAQQCVAPPAKEAPFGRVITVF
jgi:hypothetical protein